MTSIQRVAPGSPLRISARNWNAIGRATEQVLNQSARPVAGEYGVVRVTNETDRNTLLRREPVGLGPPQQDVVDYDDLNVGATGEFSQRALLVAENITEEVVNENRWGIAIDPIPWGGIGNVQVGGTAIVRVIVKDAAHRFVEPRVNTDDTTKEVMLQTSDGGICQIVHKFMSEPAENEEDELAEYMVVRFGGGSGQQKVRFRATTGPSIDECGLLQINAIKQEFKKEVMGEGENETITCSFEDVGETMPVKLPYYGFFAQDDEIDADQYGIKAGDIHYGYFSTEHGYYIIDHCIFTDEVYLDRREDCDDPGTGEPPDDPPPAECYTLQFSGGDTAAYNIVLLCFDDRTECTIDLIAAPAMSTVETQITEDGNVTVNTTFPMASPPMAMYTLGMPDLIAINVQGKDDAGADLPNTTANYQYAKDSP